MNQLNEYVKNYPLFSMILERGIKIIILIFLFLLLSRFVRFLSKKLLIYAQNRLHSLGHRKGGDSEKRLTTIVHLVDTTLRVIFIIIALLMVLKEVGLDITPLLTGAGIAGVAIGFGAQSLVKDIISGFFILLEDQIRIGDQVLIAGLSGSVEKMDLRTTTIRDADGTIHIIPNGEIKTVSNKSIEYSVAIINILLPYQVDIRKAFQIIETELKKYNENSNFRHAFKSSVTFIGITAMNPINFEIRLSVQTDPYQKYNIENDLRRHILESFSEAGIALPSPRT
jgi:small conductance mechanosensitive channel